MCVWILKASGRPCLALLAVDQSHNEATVCWVIMLTVHAESALSLMSDSLGCKILMIHYRELVIHSNQVVICGFQDIDVVVEAEGRSDPGVQHVCKITIKIPCTNVSRSTDLRSVLPNRKFKFLNEITALTCC